MYRRVVAGAAIVLLAAVDGRAQQMPFGIGGAAGSRDLVTGMMSADAGTSDVRGTGGIVPSNAALVGSQWVTDLRAGLTVRPTLNPVSWQMTTDAAAARTDRVTGMTIRGVSGGTSVAWAIDARTSLHGNASVAYQPSYSLFLTPDAFNLFASALAQADPTSGALPVGVVDYSVARAPSYTGRVSVGLTRALTQRTSLAIDYGQGGRDYTTLRNRDSKDVSGSGRLAYRLTRNLAVHAGYGRRSAGFYGPTGLTTYSVDDVDAGLDFAGSLRIGRSQNTRVSFRTGSTIVQNSGRRRVSLNGNANLSHSLGQVGALSLSYNRAVQVDGGFRSPIMTDSVVASGTAMVGRRVSLIASAGTVRGRVLAGSGTYRTDTGSGKVNVAIARRAFAFAEYLLLKGDYGRGLNAPVALATDYTRQTVRVGVLVNLSLLQADRGRVRPRPVRPQQRS